MVVDFLDVGVHALGSITVVVVEEPEELVEPKRSLLLDDNSSFTVEVREIKESLIALLAFDVRLWVRL